MSATADFVIRNRALQRYILADEKIVIATRRHWARLWEPILTTTGAFALGLAILVAVDPNVRDQLAWVWLPFLVLGARLLWKWLDWRAEWFVMTDRRLILLTGFLVHRVAMMPSEKVTDLGYERTPMGQVLGYGTFIFETAGQDQALDRITWVPRPDSRYRLIIATLFHPDAADAEAAAQSGPAGRPQVVAPAETPPPAAPPALMPRIGRRSNPPTQRIEVTHLRDQTGSGGVGSGGAVVGGASGGSAGTGSDSAGSGGVGSDGVGSGGSYERAGYGASYERAGYGRAGYDRPGYDQAGYDEAAPGAVVSGGATNGPDQPGAGQSAGRAGAGADGDQPARVGWSPTGSAAASSTGGGNLPGRTSGGKGGDHVPGGPTSATDGSDSLPSPFIEGGKDPKIR
ncbi:PH domain-containing protein [Promicromonospora sukumoe]|uniref:PH domain-containing protein n=1 Tax=Promicromonospora sukumoe TaxID=88382 RepID=UPI00036B6886|nr:PH domain-containing protein [Promicromonospora sukumoe]